MRPTASLVLAALLAFAACDSAPPPNRSPDTAISATPTSESSDEATLDTSATETAPIQVEAPTPSPTPALSSVQEILSASGPLLIPTPSTTPAPFPVPTPTPSPTFTPTPTVTPSPSPTPSPTPLLTPTPRPTPTPTSRELLAFERLSQIIPWFADPPDEWHIEAATALVKTWARSSDLGEAVARVPWVNDGIRVDEIRLIRYVRDRAHDDPTAEVVQGRYWFHVSGGEREVHLEMLVLVAHGARRNPDLTPVLYDLPQIAGSVLDDPWMGRGLDRGRRPQR